MSRRNNFWQPFKEPTEVHNSLFRRVKSHKSSYTSSYKQVGESIADSWTATQAERAFKKAKATGQKES